MCGNKLVIHVERECLGVALVFFVLNLYHNSTTIKMDRQGSITSLVTQWTWSKYKLYIIMIFYVLLLTFVSNQYMGHIRNICRCAKYSNQKTWRFFILSCDCGSLKSCFVTQGLRKSLSWCWMFTDFYSVTKSQVNTEITLVENYPDWYILLSQTRTEPDIQIAQAQTWVRPL